MTRLHSLAAGRHVSAVAMAIGLAATVVPISAAHSAEPVALILDRSESVPFPAFSELRPGDVLDLGEAGFVDLLDYTACREVRIKSGTVTINQEGYLLTGGEEQELRPGNCLEADSVAEGSEGDKGLTVTLRGLNGANKSAASLMLRFDESVRGQYGTVFVSFAGGPPKRFDMGDAVVADMPARENEADKVNVELFLQGKPPEYGVEMRTFSIDPVTVGRNTAVVVVK